MGCVVLAVAACAARLPTPTASVPPLVQGAEPASVGELATAIDADAKRSDHESDAKRRESLATEAGRNADACLAREPQAAACLYGRGIALGLLARAHPIQAGEFLNSMLEALAKAETADAGYQEAGPARVRALVLIRAPGWPLGPGDTEAGLVAARRGAKLNYARARDAALALSAAGDREDWLRQAEQGLQRK
jgi:hypothetical protein